MAEVTLESLAKRVEELERKLTAWPNGLPPGAIPLKPPYYAMPGTGDWAGALEAAGRLNESNFNFNVLKEMDEMERRLENITGHVGEA